MPGERIEIIGPPGAGKSTIYREVCKRWARTSPWVHSGVLLPPAVTGLRSLRRWIGFTLRNWYRGERSRANGSLGVEFISENQELVEFLWEAIDRNCVNYIDGLDVRLRAAFVLYKDMERIQAIRNANDRRPCLMVEGLLQKSFLRGPDGAISDKRIDKYLSLIPFPKTVFIADVADVDAIVERILRRKKRNASESGLDETGFRNRTLQWQKQFQMMENCLRKRDIPVFRIDAAEPVDVSAGRVVEILNQTGNHDEPDQQ